MGVVVIFCFVVAKYLVLHTKSTFYVSPLKRQPTTHWLWTLMNSGRRLDDRRQRRDVRRRQIMSRSIATPTLHHYPRPDQQSVITVGKNIGVSTKRQKIVCEILSPNDVTIIHTWRHRLPQLGQFKASKFVTKTNTWKQVSKIWDESENICKTFEFFTVV